MGIICIIYKGDFMNIDLRELLTKDSMIIDQDVNIPTDYYVQTVRLEGKVYYSIEEELVISAKLKGVMILEDSYNLELVEYPFEIELEEVLTSEDLKTYKNEQKNENILDITDILWQNIVLEVPISYSLTDQHEQLKGDGWELRDNDSKKIDSRLAVLNELLEEGKE